MDLVIGIDLGTTNSASAIYEYGDITIMRNDDGELLTPSAVYIQDIDTVIVGRAAKNQYIIDPEKTVLSVKRYMGTDKLYYINGKNYTPEEIASFIIKKIKAFTEKKVGKPIFKAVITVPAYFNDTQRKATMEAGRMAGLDVIRIINEPTASCLSYGFGKLNEEKKIIVYDLGGGTFDVSLLDIGNGVYNVLATNGDNMLGGIDFDKMIVQSMLKTFHDTHSIDLTSDKYAIAKLYDEAEKAKILLSEQFEAKVQIPFISANEKGPLHLNIKITRKEFEELIEQYVEYTISLLSKLIDEAELAKSDIDTVILVGGSSRIPLIRKKIYEMFPGKVAEKINPEEVVCRGAAIQGAIVEGSIDDIVLVDVTPLSLGVEVVGGLFIPLIDRNSQIPCENKKIFTTVADNQKIVEINIYQGERKICAENVHLGKFMLKGIQHAKAGDPKILVTFSIDVNGTLNVKAVDEQTRVTQNIILETYSSKLKIDEIKNIIRLSRDFEQSDNEFEKKIKVRNKIKHLKSFLQEKLNTNSIKMTIRDELSILLDEIEKNIDTNQIEKLSDFYEALSYYKDEFDYQENEYINNQLLRG